MHQLKEAGKIRAIGVSNFTLEQLKEANAEGYVDVVEDEYSLIHRQAESELFPYLAEHSISFVPYFPLASGLLTGKYTQETTFSNDDIRSKSRTFKVIALKKSYRLSTNCDQSLPLMMQRFLNLCWLGT